MNEIRYYWHYDWDTDEITKESILVEDDDEPDFPTFTMQQLGKYVGHLFEYDPDTGEKYVVCYTTRDKFAFYD